MSRTLPTGMATAVSSTKVPAVFLVELDWPSGMVYAWNGYGDISWSGHTWVGTGHAGTISPINESRDGAANGVSLSLAGVPSSEIAEALADNSQGRAGKIYFGVLAADGTFAINPYLIFDGVIDVAPIEDSGDTATISVKLEKEFIDSRTRGRRYTHEDQQIDYAGDLFFQYVAGLATKDVTWGAVTASAGGGSAGGGSNNGQDYPLE